MSAAEVEQALLALNPHVDAVVIRRRLKILDLDIEMLRRVDVIESGKVESLDVVDAHAQLRAELGKPALTPPNNACAGRFLGMTRATIGKHLDRQCHRHGSIP